MAGIHRAKKWRDENPKAAAILDVEAVERDKQRRIPRVEVPPVRKKEKIRKERMKSIQTWKVRSNNQSINQRSLQSHTHTGRGNLRTRCPDRHNGDGGSKRRRSRKGGGAGGR